MHLSPGKGGGGGGGGNSRHNGHDRAVCCPSVLGVNLQVVVLLKVLEIECLN